MWAVSRLCGFYPGICLTTEEKARRNLSHGSDDCMERVYYCPVLADIWKEALFCLQDPRLCPFVLLKRMLLRWRSLWSIGGIILTKRNGNTWMETCPSVNFFLSDWPGMEPGTQVSINASRYLAANTHRLHNKTKKLIFLQDRNIIYSENNTKHINALCRQPAVLVTWKFGGFSQYTANYIYIYIYFFSRMSQGRHVSASLILGHLQFLRSLCSLQCQVWYGYFSSNNTL
jgi:hypothetical protein